MGNLIAQRESYTRAGKTDDIDRTFTYDDRGRLLNETTQVNGGEEAVVYYEYDELGRLAARRLGEGTSAIAEQSEYDIRSWLTKKSSELFDMSLGHSYTENITSWQWQHKGDPSGDGPAEPICLHLRRPLAAGEHDSVCERGIEQAECRTFPYL